MSKWGPKGCSDWLAMWLPKLTPAQFAVLFAMTRYADSETGELFASQQAFADDTGLGKGYVNDIVTNLVAAGAIRIKVPGSRGRGRSAVIALVDDPNALARHVAGVKAKRKERGDKSKAAREAYASKGKADKTAMRASYFRSASGEFDRNSEEWVRQREKVLEQQKQQEEQRRRALKFRSRDREQSQVLQHARKVLGDGAADLVLALFESYGKDVSETIMTIDEAAMKPDARVFLAEVVKSRQP